jgi:hypothetical protein
MLLLSGLSLAAILLFSITVLRGWAKASGDPASANVSSDLRLTVREESGRLLIGWSRDSEAIRGAKRAILTVTEAGRSEDVELGPDLLRRNRLVYSPLTGDVSFRLLVRGGAADGATVESVRFLTFRRP